MNYTVIVTKNLEEPNGYLLESIKQSEKDLKAGRVVSFKSGKEALDYLDTETKHDQQIQATP